MIKTKRIISHIIAVCLCLSSLMPCVSAEETANYATREYIVSEFVQSVGRNTLEKSDAILDIFSDSEKISAQYREDISRAIVGGILKGYDDRTIRPDETVSRLEAMVMLARCIPHLEASGDAIEFTDVPEWAKEDIEYLSKAGLVNGYGDGTMGANDLITTQQVALLIERSDNALRTVDAKESFYGYINEKSFRNAIPEDETSIDPIHGAVIAKANYWSSLNDIYNEITENETEILNKIINDEIEVEKGTAEQRVRDMLECIDSDIAVNESDKKNVTDMRKAILDVKSIDEFLNITSDIYKQAGINVVFNVFLALDKETGIPYPKFSIDTAGKGGFLAYREKTDTKEYRGVYAELISEYLKEMGADFNTEDINKAIRLQEESAKDVDYFNEIVSYFSVAYKYGVMSEEEITQEVMAMKLRNPLFFDKDKNYIGTTNLYVSKNKADADDAFEGFDLCEELTDYGFSTLEKIIIPVSEITEFEKNLISEENLSALKINAILKLNEYLGVSMTENEKILTERIARLPLLTCVTSSAKELREALTEENSIGKEIFKDTTGVEYSEGILSAVNLKKLRQLLPDDIGLVYAKYYYDDETTDVIAKMIEDISAAYAQRFKNNTWMDEKTKENALKKLENIVAIIGYPKNYEFPDIIPISDGGSLFSNMLSIRRHTLSDIIRCTEESGYIRTQMVLPPDEVNAGYLPEFNSINIPAGYLSKPIYDKNASYATNLGAIGMTIGHEIGHAFDSNGALRDENGCINNWWTDKDYEEFRKIQQEFINYYNNFEVIDGVVQDASITISENMADFAALQIVMDIIGDDKKAQQEFLESYARFWAQLGTVSYLTDNRLLSDVHASNVVRVNAIVASSDAFYEIYGIEEGDPMYVAPEDRLRLW